MVAIASSPKPIGTENVTKWSCANGRTLNISTAITDRYFYVGAAGSVLTGAALETMGEELPMLEMLQNITVAINGTLAEAAGQPNLTPSVAEVVARRERATEKFMTGLEAAVQMIVMTEVWYFRSDQRDEFDAAQARLLAMVEGCARVTA
jgi:hypothetical protein